jgi:crossover junction endodeoxyribonuclease RuvC
MRVLGIDCGSERTGYGVIDTDGRRHRLLACGVIRTAPREGFERRLLAIARRLREIIGEFAPESVAVEEVFYAQNARSALKLAHVRGVALLAAAEAGVPLGEYSALKIKQSVAGYGRAEKSQVALMVRTLVGRDAHFETEDASDAVAIAICHAAHCAAGGALR